MEEIIYNILEKSIVSGAFVLLLWKFISTYSDTLKEISNSLKDFGETLTGVSNTLLNIDSRLSFLEDRVSDLEKGGGVK